MADLRTTLFVGNLSVFCSEAELRALFSPFGNIEEIRMAKSEDNAKHLSYGFVKFDTIESVQIAIQELQGVVVCGRPLKLGNALSRSTKKEGEETQHQPYSTASAHVTFISHQVEHLVTEESLRYLFSRFGEVVDAVLCKSNVDARQGRQSGYGFIHFPGSAEGVKSAFEAADALRDVMIDEVNYKCRVSKDLEQQLQQSAQGHPTRDPSLPLPIDQIEREVVGSRAHGASARGGLNSIHSGPGGYDQGLSHISPLDELPASEGMPFQLRQQLRPGGSIGGQQQMLNRSAISRPPMQQHHPQQQRLEPQYGGYASPLLSAEAVSHRLRQSPSLPRDSYNSGRGVHPKEQSPIVARGPSPQNIPTLLDRSDWFVQYQMGVPRGVTRISPQAITEDIDARGGSRPMRQSPMPSAILTPPRGRQSQLGAQPQHGGRWPPHNHQQQFAHPQDAVPQWQRQQQQQQHNHQHQHHHQQHHNHLQHQTQHQHQYQRQPTAMFEYEANHAIHASRIHSQQTAYSVSVMSHLPEGDLIEGSRYVQSSIPSIRVNGDFDVNPQSFGRHFAQHQLQESHDKVVHRSHELHSGPAWQSESVFAFGLHTHERAFPDHMRQQPVPAFDATNQNQIREPGPSHIQDGANLSPRYTDIVRSVLDDADR